jgi:hypothetical protein
MARINITCPDALYKKLKEKINERSPEGMKKGDLRLAVIEAIEAWIKAN